MWFVRVFSGPISYRCSTVPHECKDAAEGHLTRGVWDQEHQQSGEHQTSQTFEHLAKQPNTEAPCGIRRMYFCIENDAKEQVFHVCVPALAQRVSLDVT